MRCLVFVPCVLACTSPSTPSGSMYGSVRARLTAMPTRLFADARPNAGSIDARRWTHDGWQDGTSSVSVTNGELVASVDPTGGITLTKLAIALEPISIPEVVFSKPAQLTGVRFTLARPAAGTAVWRDDDDATATLVVDLDLDWGLVIDTSTIPLGTQHLPAMSAAVTATGDAGHVDATLTLHASGEVWSWAGLLELTRLQLELDAATFE